MDAILYFLGLSLYDFKCRFDLSISQSIYLSIYLSIYSSLYLSIYLSEIVFLNQSFFENTLSLKKTWTQAHLQLWTHEYF